MTDNAAVPAPPPAYGGVPVVPAAPQNVAPRSLPQAIWRGAVGLALVLAGIGGQVAGAGFPSNAPVEMFANFAITVTAVFAGIILIVFAVFAAVARSFPLTNGPVSPLAITAFAVSAVALIIWFVTIPGVMIDAAQTGDRMRYGTLSGPAFGTGFLWATGIVMGAIAFRSPALVSRILSVGAVVLGFAVIATNIYAAAIYSAGLTD